MNQLWPTWRIISVYKWAVSPVSEPFIYSLTYCDDFHCPFLMDPQKSPVFPQNTWRKAMYWSYAWKPLPVPGRQTKLFFSAWWEPGKLILWAWGVITGCACHIQVIPKMCFGIAWIHVMSKLDLLKVIFTFCHGKSPLNHHLGEGFLFQPPSTNLR